MKRIYCNECKYLYWLYRQAYCRNKDIFVDNKFLCINKNRVYNLKVKRPNLCIDNFKKNKSLPKWRNKTNSNIEFSRESLMTEHKKQQETKK